MSADRVTIEVRGLTLFTHHGITDEEQDAGQQLVLDMAFESANPIGAMQSDDVTETVDYGLVSERAADFATSNRYRTLEALISDIADVLIAEFGLGRISIRATKTVPPLDLEFNDGGVSVELERAV
jgi:dihydroneopterin aldolase